MNNLEFVEKAKRIESTLKTKYKLGGWGQQEGDTYLFDCVCSGFSLINFSNCLIKSILWGFNFEAGGHGGAVYASNGVPDIGADQMINVCNEVSTDFNNIEAGEAVWLSGHIGIYIGDGQVIEATGAWERKVLVSNIGNNGERSRNGRQVYSWTKHGKLPYIEYVDKNPLKCKVHLQDIGWTDWINIGDIAGTTGEGRRIEAIIFDSSNIDLKYRAHVENIGWQEWVNKGEIAGTTGQGLKVEALEIQSSVPLKVSEHVENIGWMPASTGTNIKVGTEGKSLRLEAIKIELA